MRHVLPPLRCGAVYTARPANGSRNSDGRKKCGSLYKLLPKPGRDCRRCNGRGDLLLKMIVFPPPAIQGSLPVKTPIVVFDLDGTLIDTAPDLVASVNHT